MKDPDLEDITFLDFETRSKCSLKKLGSRNYAHHPSTELVCCVLRRGDDYEVITPYTSKPPRLADGNYYAAHNAAGFDRHVWDRMGWKQPYEWIDTSELARVGGYPKASIEWIGEHLAGQPKDKAGSLIMRSLSKVSKKTGDFTAELTWPVLKRVIEYCKIDVDIMFDAYASDLHIFLHADVVGIERADRAMNDRGICLDRELAEVLLERDAELVAGVLDRAGVTVDQVRSTKKFSELMGGLGVEIENCQAPTIEALLDHDDEQVALLAAARLGCSTIAAGKLRAGLSLVSPDGRLRDSLRYYSAHAQPNSEPVRTPAGWTTMGAIRVGDLVQGRTGPTRVMAVHPQGVRPIARVTMTDGSWTRCDGDHLWDVTTVDGAHYVRRTADLGHLKQGVKSRYRIPLIRPSAGGTSTLPLDPYMLGALLGDGCMVGETPRFTSADPEIAEAFVLPPNTRLTAREEHRGGRRVATHYRIMSDYPAVAMCGHPGRCVRGVCVRCYYAAVRAGTLPPAVRHNPVRRALEGLGLWGRGSFDKFVPRTYLDASAPDRLALLQGLLDTDGCARSAGVAKYSTCSAPLRDAAVELFQSLGGTARVRTEPCNDGVIFSVLGRLKFPVFRLARKLNRWGETSRDPVRCIASVRPDGFEEATCISVDAEDGLYLTRGYIVTHNTGRWGGKGMQLQNLPGGPSDKKDPVYAAIKDDAALLRLLYP